MKKATAVPLSFLFSCLILMQATAQNLTEAEEMSIRSEVNRIFNDMLIIAEDLDYDGLSSGVDDRYHAGFIANGNYYAHYSSLIADLKPNAQGVRQQDISVGEKKTTVLSDDIVLMTVSGVSRAELVDGREIKASFHWSFVYKKIDNSWKVVFSHQSQAN